MPKKRKEQNYLSDYIYTRNKKVKRQKNKKTSKLFMFTFMVTTILLVMLVANIFSGFITISDLNLNMGDKYFTGKDLYAVELSNFDNSADAFVASEEVLSQLGAGYVVNDNGIYRVLASAYLAKSNAESVLSNLNENGVTASLYKVVMPSTFMELELADAQKTALENCFNMFNTAYTELYELSIGLDKGLKTLEQCQMGVISLKSDCTDLVETFNQNILVPNTSEVIYSKIYFNMLLDDLQELADTSIESSVYSSVLKRTYFKIVYCYINLSKEI